MGGLLKNGTTTVAGVSNAVSRPANDRQRWQLVTALVCAIFALAMTLILLPAPTTPFFQGFDNWWHSFATAPAGYQPSGFVAFLDAFGRPPGIIVLPIVLLIMGVTRRWWAMLFVFLTYLVPPTLAQVLKGLVDRPRPANPLVIVDHGSFPSGHVVSTAAFVIMVAVLLSPAIRRYWWPVGIVFLALMMWSRTFLGAHWLTDTFAGAAVGTCVTLVLWWAFAPLLAKDTRRNQARKQAKNPSSSPTSKDA